MVSVNCVKISYKGLTRHIVCNKKFQYDDLLKTVMDQFNIESSCKLAIEFYDEKGHRYNKDTFEYLLLLFPSPQKLFFIRLDTSKALNLIDTEGTQSVLQEDERTPFGDSKLNNRQTTKGEPEPYYEAVPVKRQNCFIGEIPASTSSQQLATSTNPYHPDYLSLQIGKRLRALKQSPTKKKHLSHQTSFKRSLRV